MRKLLLSQQPQNFQFTRACDVDCDCDVAYLTSYQLSKDLFGTLEPTKIEVVSSSLRGKVESLEQNTYVNRLFV